MSPRRITVSTVGFLPGLRRLVVEHPRVTITVSVHSPYEEERARLIPLQHRFPLSACLDVLDEHVAATRRKVYLAYLLIDGLNDTDTHARDLARLVAQRRRPELFHANVIAYNPAAGVNAAYQRPSSGRVRRFLRVLREHGVHATRRTQFGDGIDAACGQLHARYLAEGRADTSGAATGRTRARRTAGGKTGVSDGSDSSWAGGLFPGPPSGRLRRMKM
jgi:23S rRNA (adenine-C8)-methyltransferase